MVSIHAVRERAAGFSNVKSIALELIDKVHRQAVGMGICSRIVKTDKKL